MPRCSFAFLIASTIAEVSFAWPLRLLIVSTLRRQPRSNGSLPRRQRTADTPLRVSRKRSAQVSLAFFTIFRCRLCGQLLQPFSQPFELLVCAELVQAVNADLNRLSVTVGDTVDVFGATHDLFNSPQNP